MAWRSDSPTPSHQPKRGVIVVRTGVDHAVGGDAMRQVDVGAAIAEAELQHGEPGNLMPLAQGVHLRSDIAQIFGKKGQAAQGFAELIEQIVLGAVDPATVHSGRLAGRDLPELFKAAEVVEADVIAGLGGPA